MDMLTAKERREALEVIRAESECIWTNQAAMSVWLEDVESAARRLHKLYESACSDDLGTEGNADRNGRIKELEERLERAFKLAGLGLYLNGDPRGNPVGILTPKTGKYNTWGGAEAGWRL